MVGQLDPAYSSMEKRGAAYLPSVAEYGKKHRKTRNISYAAGCICGVGLAAWMVYITLMVNKDVEFRDQQPLVFGGPNALNYSGLNVKQGMELEAVKNILAYMAQDQASSRLEANPDEMQRRTAKFEVEPPRNNLPPMLVAVSTISIRTGTEENAQSQCKAVLRICDIDHNCCETTSTNRGLDDTSKADKLRRSGNVDTYVSPQVLDQCAQAVLDPNLPWTAKLTTSDPDGADGWFVDWIKLYARNWTYTCPVKAWLDNDNLNTLDKAGPNTYTALCSKLVGVSEISIMTGSRPDSQSDIRAVLRICDINNSCCETSSQGNGLDDLSKNDRESGQLDTYSSPAMLHTCTQAILEPSGPLTAQLTVSNPGGSNAWFVDWIKLTDTNGLIYMCLMEAWLDDGPSLFPDSKTAFCESMCRLPHCK